MSRRIFLAVIQFVCLICFPQMASAIAPGFIPDSKLAESPIIVVAKWNGAARKDNSLVVDGVLRVYEVATEIEVKRVVKGDISLGKHRVLVAFAIGWSEQDPLVTSYTSTEMAGDADATVDNLWFLSTSRSRVDSKEYPFLNTYRGVQPLALESYFKALQTQDFRSHIPELLKSKDEIVLIRTLKVIAGGTLPWPYIPWHSRRPVQSGEPLKDQAASVRALIDDSSSRRVRQIATAIYGKIAGESSTEFMRTKLSDDDSIVRAIALGILASHKERVEADIISKAVRGVDNPGIACALIQQLADWGDASVVPALIEFLQDDRFSGRVGSDWDVPALKSREALFKITAHWFPFDVEKSRQAWGKAQELAAPEERKAYLDRTVSDAPNPWKATIVTEGNRTFVEISNKSKWTMTLARQPTDIDVTSARGSTGVGVKGDAEQGKDGFVVLAPQSSYRFELQEAGEVDWFKRVTAERPWTMDLAYMQNGNKFGVNAWLGVVSVQTGGR